MWPLVGRVDELELVEGALAGPDGAGVVLAGSAGVGKTRLAGEVLARASAAGRTTAWVQATRSASAIPFGAFAHLLPGDLGEAGPVNLLRLAGDAIAGRGGDGRLVLAVDDAHLLDASSAALLGHLVTTSCFVVVTVRSREPIPDAIVSLWKDGPLDRVELQPLSEDEVVGLLHDVLGGPVEGATRRRLWEACRGNPLYLLDLVTGGIDAGLLTAEHGVWRWRGPSLATPRITELVESRLTDLTPAERAMLEIVAHSEPLEAALLDVLTERADRERLERFGLLQVITSGRRRAVGLSHPLYAEAIRAATPPSLIRRIWHQLAEVLAATGARRSGDLLRLATWRLDAGDVDDGPLFLAAAERAIALLDHALAARLAQAAADVGGGFEARYLLGTAAIGTGDGERAERILVAVELETQTDDQRVRAAIRRADNLFWRLGRGEEACAVLAGALGDVKDQAAREPLLITLAGLQLFGGATAASLATIDEALVRRGSNQPAVLNAAIPAYTWGRILRGRLHDALDASARWASAPELFMGGAVEFTPVFVSAASGAVALVDGRLADSESAALEAFEESVLPGKSTFRGFFGFWLGWARRVRGLPRSAATVLVEADGLLRELDLYRHRTACLGELAHSYALIGDTGAAASALEAADAARVPSFVMDFSYLMGARAWLAHASGERSTARRLACEWADGCRSYGQTVFEAFARHDLARLGDPEAASGPLAAIAETVDGALIPAFATHAAALAADDARALDTVSAAFERMGALLYAAEAAAAAAGAFRRQGRKGSAMLATARANRLCEQCEGARTPALESVETLIPLTRRELEIAGLAARGLTNREIAERLDVSARTVDNHLHNAYTKLGVSRRAELAAIFYLE